jgi:multidrug transporter EmrE-like cation transporter
MLFPAYALLILAISLGVFGQLLLKHGMSKRPGFKIEELFSLVSNYSVIFGFLFYGISTLLYLRVLANLDLSLAYPTVGLSYVFIVILSQLLFKEQVSITRWLAIIIICTGVALVGFSR